MTWQYVTWAAGAVTVAALALACVPFLPPAATAGRATAPKATGALVVVVALVAAEVALGDLVTPPLWAQAGWALLTAAAAMSFAARGHRLARRPGGPRTPSPTGASPASPLAAAGSMVAAGGEQPTDPLSEQDDLVQTLVLASYALQMGDERRARQALERALRRSRATLDELVRQRGTRQGFVRAAPALVSRDISRLT